MMTKKTCVGLTAIAAMAFMGQVSAFTNPCVYQSYKCGYTLSGVDYVYTTLELTDAVELTGSIPTLEEFQLLNVIYRCDDVAGELVANSYCIAGCMSSGDPTRNDMCAM